MKKLITGFGFIILFLFISKCLMVMIDKGNSNDIIDKISKNTKIDDIIYINKYDDYYIVKDRDYIYVFDNEYIEINRDNIDNLCDKDYDIIYKDSKLLYMDNYNDNEGLVFKYYDVYTCKIVDYIMVGGSYG